MVKIVSVKFKNSSKSYYFAPNPKETYEKGMGVIVETAKGLEYATVVIPEGEVEESEIVPPLKPVVRIATKRDEEQIERNRERRGEALKTAQEKIAARGLDMKLVDCEFAFDGSKVIFFFTAETRVDFRELIKDLSSAFHMRIELRQINIREEIKMTGGLGQCGRECCCVGCMSEPLKVSVKMAKNQGLSLNPAKISGLCGKLMCCLAYENDYYSEACKQVPKIGSEAETPDGKGIVVNVNMLKMLVKVKIEQNDSVTYRDYPVDGIRFMRGNVVMGKDFDAEDDELPDEEPDKEVDKPAPAPAERHEKREDNGGENRNGGGGNRGNRDNNNRNKNKHRGGGNENRENRNDNGRNDAHNDNGNRNENRNRNKRDRDNRNENRGNQNKPDRGDAGRLADGGQNQDGRPANFKKKNRHGHRENHGNPNNNGNSNPNAGNKPQGGGQE